MTRPTSSLIRITAPASEPVSLTQAKAHLRVDHTDDDTMIGAMIQAAREAAEHQTGRALVTQTWELVLDAFPAAEIELVKPPVQSITSITYEDTAGATQTLSATAYALAAYDTRGWVIPDVDTAWPGTYGAVGSVRVRFVAGYGAAAAVPTSITSWMLLQIGAAYRNREAFASGQSVSELPNRWVDSLLDAFRVYAG